MALLKDYGLPQSSTSPDGWARFCEQRRISCSWKVIPIIGSCSRKFHPYFPVFLYIWFMFLIDLKELTITAVAGFPHEEKAFMRNPFMAKVSIFWYALELIPGLRRTILYCRKKRSGVIHEPVHGKLLQSWTPLLTEWSENLVWPTELEEAGGTCDCQRLCANWSMPLPWLKWKWKKNSHNSLQPSI